MVDDQNKILEVKGVTKRYRAGKTVFSRVNLTFGPGDGVLLTGPNGSGKTTFLKLLSVNTFPTEGSIFYGKLNIHEKPYDYLEYVGLVHDEEGLPLHLSAVELMEWVLRSREQWNEKAVNSIHSLLDHLELDEARDDEIGTYSTGMKKKTQIAAAMIIDPDILILDEPLRGLDTTATQKTITLLEKAIKRGAIVLMASHSRTQVEETGLFGKRMEFPL